jgi:hypothetical protein
MSGVREQEIGALMIDRDAKSLARTTSSGAGRGGAGTRTSLSNGLNNPEER